MFVMEVYHITRFHKGMVILQISTDIVKVEPGLYSETCLASSFEGHEATDTKVERISDTEDDEEPVPVIYPAVKAKRKVSCMLVLLGIFHRYLELPTCFNHLRAGGSLHKMTMFNRF
jgi:hypothetical protein